MTSPDAFDDDKPELSSSTLSALQEFLSEQKSHKEKFEALQNASEKAAAARTPLSMAAFSEDWNASQFWYSDETANELAAALLRDAGPETRIAFVSAPSAFIAAYNLLLDVDEAQRPQLTLLEFDARFGVLSEFVRYDYNAPTRLPVELKGQFERVIVDPPFLSDECQTKAALTVRWLLKAWDAEVRVCACTGERMEQLIERLYEKVGVRTTDFEVRHEKGLSNEFRCYANWEDEAWKWVAKS